MDLWKKLTGELVDIVQWLDDSQATRDTLVYRFERYNNEIKHGAKLVVREGQAAVFVNEGKVADVFAPGTYTLTTQNLPILATLKGWKHGFESPFKAEVYFVNTRQFTDLKWGTMNPVMLRDAEFGPVRLRAFGTYAMKASDPAALIREVAGTSARLTAGNITEQIRGFIVSRFAEVLAESKVPALDLAANYSELGGKMITNVKPAVSPYGVELTALVVENISLPPEVEQALDSRTKMGVIGNLNAYSQLQAAEAMRDAAKNPSGLAGAGVAMGAGFAMAQQMGQAMSQTAPPIPQSGAFFIAVNNQQAGPFDLSTLSAKARAGEIGRGTLVWKQGMSGWAEAGSVPELASIFALASPPLPGPPPIPGR